MEKIFNCPKCKQKIVHTPFGFEHSSSLDKYDWKCGKIINYHDRRAVAEHKRCFK